MLELLSLRKGTTLTKEMFLNHLYGGMDEPELKIIDVFICKLRKKLANASAGQELHRDRLGPRLRAARARRGRRAHSGLEAPSTQKAPRAGLFFARACPFAGAGRPSDQADLFELGRHAVLVERLGGMELSAPACMARAIWATSYSVVQNSTLGASPPGIRRNSRTNS